MTFGPLLHGSGLKSDVQYTWQMMIYTWLGCSVWFVDCFGYHWIVRKKESWDRMEIETVSPRGFDISCTKNMFFLGHLSSENLAHTNNDLHGQCLCEVGLQSQRFQKYMCFKWRSKMLWSHTREVTPNWRTISLWARLQIELHDKALRNYESIFNTGASFETNLDILEVHASWTKNQNCLTHASRVGTTLIDTEQRLPENDTNLVPKERWQRAQLIWKRLNS